MEDLANPKVSFIVPICFVCTIFPRREERAMGDLLLDRTQLQGAD